MGWRQMSGSGFVGKGRVWVQSHLVHVGIPIIPGEGFRGDGQQSAAGTRRDVCRQKYYVHRFP